MNQIVGELLLISLIVVAGSVLMLAVAPHPAKEYCDIKVKDSPPPASTGELFDVLMVSGRVNYGELVVELVNTSAGNIVDRATFSGSSIRGKVISASVNDADSEFGVGDILRFRCTPGAVQPGHYEVVVVGGNRVVFDGYVEIR